MQHKSGFFFACASSFGFALVAWLVKSFNGGLPPATLLFYRSFFTALILLPFIWTELKKLKLRAYRLLLTRGFWGGAAILIYFFNIVELGPTLASNISSFSTVFSFLIGKLMNREHTTKPQLVGIALCNINIFLIATAFSEVSKSTLLLGLLGSFCAALSVNTARKSKNANISPNMIYFGFAIATIFAPIPFTKNLIVPKELSSYIAILAMVAAAWLAQYTLVHAYATLGNAKASAIGRLVVVWAFALELVTRTGVYSNMKLLICGITVAGCALITLPKREAQSAEAFSESMASKEEECATESTPTQLATYERIRH